MCLSQWERCKKNIFTILHLVVVVVQRPSAKELLKHRFIRNAKKTSCLVELIDRYRRWKAQADDSDDDLSDKDTDL